MSDAAALSILTLVVDTDRPGALTTLQAGLPEGTRLLAPVITEHAAFADFVQFHKPDMLVMVRTEVDAGASARVERVMRDRPLPVVIFVDRADPGLAALMTRQGVSAFVVDGFVQARLSTTLVVAVERFRLFEALQTELRKSLDMLAARKTIEQAKGLLMERRNMTEQDAYRALRTMAMRQGKSVKDVAESLISISDLLP